MASFGKPQIPRTQLIGLLQSLIETIDREGQTMSASELTRIDKETMRLLLTINKKKLEIAELQTRLKVQPKN